MFTSDKQNMMASIYLNIGKGKQRHKTMFPSDINN